MSARANNSYSAHTDVLRHYRTCSSETAPLHRMRCTEILLLRATALSIVSALYVCIPLYSLLHDIVSVIELSIPQLLDAPITCI
jgi:hypothetical protein